MATAKNKYIKYVEYCESQVKLIEENYDVPNIYLDFIDKYFLVLNAFGYNVKDIEILDGSHSGNFRENSFVIYHIEECKNWTFGIWIDVDIDNQNEGLDVDFFCVPDCDYDFTAFKLYGPQQCLFSNNVTLDFKSLDIDVILEEDDSFGLTIKEEFAFYFYGILDIIEHICNQPICAWYSASYWKNLNLEYVSYIKILFKYIKYKLKR